LTLFRSQDVAAATTTSPRNCAAARGPGNIIVIQLLRDYGHIVHNPPCGATSAKVPALLADQAAWWQTAPMSKTVMDT
jgi:hypothetical protein